MWLILCELCVFSSISSIELLLTALHCIGKAFGMLFAHLPWITYVG